ncbi:MAG: metal-dependent hydrolase [Acidimicrobiales bacterium]|nr:metal-dependent hydrolase [Acidimicrobiales bacterium]
MTTTAPARDVPTRRVRFEYPLDGLPKDFAGDPVLSRVLMVLSSVFPDGEDYFVRSVRHFRHEVTDPELAEQVKGFIGQESIHGREHRAFNDKLAELGYPTKKIERFIERSLGFRERVQSPKANLATTAALEHFTAVFAEQILTSEEARDALAHDEVRSLFLWHALEESEHKAVAFDVYHHVGGREWVRRLVMNVITTGLVVGASVAVAAMLVLDPRARRDPRGALRELGASPFFTKGMWTRLRDYNRRGFHPDDVDTTELVERWRDELFGDDGTLRSRVS